MRLDRLNLTCPTCGGRMHVRSSRQISEVAREVYAECRSAAHEAVAIKYYIEITADLHDGDYLDGLHIPASLRKQALAPVVPRADKRQLVMPGCELPRPTHQALAANELRCPKCGQPTKYTVGEQLDPLTRELFAVCLSHRCDGKYRVVATAATCLVGEVPGLRNAREAITPTTTANDGRQLTIHFGS